MTAKRLLDRPILTPETHASLGGNVNGPSLLRVPSWVARPLGRYYLYFAHHQGTFIRMAYADQITGPYTVYAPGVLALADTPFTRHIASPDVHVDEGQRRLYMYYHGCGCSQPNPLPYNQVTCYAESADGLAFLSDRVYLGPSYLRTFEWDGWTYGFAGGPERRLYRTSDRRQVFEVGQALGIEGENFTDLQALRQGEHDSSTIYRTRHIAFHQRAYALNIYYCNVGDAPERIKMTHVDLRPDWTEWRGSRYVEVLRPETPYEGVAEPIRRSSGGASHSPVHEARDPFAYEEDGRVYLFYTVAGEKGIALAEIS